MPEEIVGKSSGWTGPIEEYTKNQGSVGRKRIVFVGASYLFVLRRSPLVGQEMGLDKRVSPSGCGGCWNARSP